MYTCNVCKKELVIELYPDFASSGMWCKHCGVNFSNPNINFKKIPVALVYLVEIWNDYWDDISSNIDTDSVYFEQIQERINAAGYYLAGEIGQYYHCEFDEEKSKIFSLKKELAKAKRANKRGSL